MVPFINRRHLKCPWTPWRRRTTVTTWPTLPRTLKRKGWREAPDEYLIDKIK